MNGSLLEERRGDPLPLTNPGLVWLVVEGSVDVFAVPSPDAGPGPRRYLWSAEVGDVLPPAPPAAGSRFVLTAIGMGTTRLASRPLSSLTDEAMTPALDSLVASLTPLLPAGDHVTLQEVLEGGQRRSLSDGRRAGIRERTVWVRHLEGATRIGANAKLELTPSHGWVPLQDLWLEAVGETSLETLDTRAYLSGGGDPIPGLRLLTDLLQSCLEEGIASDDRRTAARLRAKALSDQALWRQAFLRLGSVLRSANPRHETAAVHDPLLAACRLVGDAAAIQFVEPPQWERKRASELLAAICRASRVRSRKVALRGRWWQEDAGPLLGSTRDDGRPVALLPAGARRYVVVDPRQGERRPVTAAVAEELRPFAVTFYRPLDDRIRSLRGLFTFVSPLITTDLASVATAALAGGLLGLALPVAVAQVFNRVIPNAHPRDLVTVLAALTAAATGAALFDITRAFALARTVGRASAAMQAALVDRLLALPLPFFRHYSVGDLIHRASAIQTAEDAIGTTTLSVVVASVFSLVNLLVLFAYDWRLALLSIFLLALAVAVNTLLVRASFRHERRQQEAQGSVAGLVFQIIAGIAKIRVSGSEGRSFAAWSVAFSKQREAAHQSGRFKVMLNVFNEVLPIACTALLFGLAGWLLSERADSLLTGDFVAFSAAFGTLFAAMVALSNSLAGMVSAVAVMEKASPILETEPEVTETRNDPGELTGLIEGTHLTFRYQQEGALVLDDVSFRVEPGQFVAFVGPSGSGKSTTLRLLLGFETPETGAVYYDGQDLGMLDISAIRNRQIGVVLQSSRLLGGDIFTNIVGASSTLTLEDAWEAAEAAGLADDIHAMPMGMHTVISEGGSTFSGGQRQRLLIARALVRKPRIILFDEATSSLDNRTQETVTRTLELSSATRLVIAHRLSTIRKADRIYVLNRGKVEETGSFDELAHAGGLFSQLIARQHA